MKEIEQEKRSIDSRISTTSKEAELERKALRVRVRQLEEANRVLKQLLDEREAHSQQELTSI
jgi:hypothetical protein